MNKNSQIAKDLRKAIELVPITIKSKEKKLQTGKTGLAKEVSHRQSTFQPVKSRFKQTKPGYQSIKVKSKNGN